MSTEGHMASADAPKTIYFIYGLYCQSCVRTLEKLLFSRFGAAVQVDFARSLLCMDGPGPGVAALNESIRPFGYFATHPSDEARDEARSESFQNGLFAQAGVGLVFSMWQVLLNLALFAFNDVPLSQDAYRLYAGASLLLFLPVLLYTAAPVLRMALASVRVRSVSMDLFLSVEILACLLVSYEAFQSQNPMYLDSLSMALSLFVLAKALLFRLQSRSSPTVNALLRDLPEEVIKLDPSGAERPIASARIRPGHRLKIKAGHKLPFDGVLLSREAELDCSQLTGEEKAVRLRAGDELHAGSTNVGEDLIVEVTAVAGGRVIDQIATSNQHQSAAKYRDSMRPPRGLDGWIVGVGILSLAVAVWSSLFGGQTFSGALVRGAFVLIALCPCVFFNSLPISYACLKKALARHMIRVGSVRALKRIGSVREILLDKTGTLTVPSVDVSGVRLNPTADLSKEEALALAKRLEEESFHPIAEAFRRLDLSPSPLRLASWEETPGLGLRARTVCGMEYRLGRRELLPEPPTPLPQVHGPGVWLMGRDDWLAFIPLSHQKLSGVDQALAHLRKRFDLGLLTGDSGESLEALGQMFHSGDMIATHCTPQQKADLIVKRQQTGHGVLFVGEGLNDSLAMSAATISVATRGCSPYVRDLADIEIPSLKALPATIYLLKRAGRILKQNMLLSLVYNVAAVAFLMSGHFTPHAAVLLMGLVTLGIFLNSFRIPGRRNIRLESRSILPHPPYGCSTSVY